MTMDQAARKTGSVRRISGRIAYLLGPTYHGNGNWANRRTTHIMKDQGPDGSEDLETQITRGSDGSLYMAQRGVHICFFALWGKGTAFSGGFG